MTEADVFARLRLIRSPNVGPVTYRQLIARFGTAAAALEAIPELAARGGKRQFSPAPENSIHAEIQHLQKYGAKMLFMDDQDYPDLLAQLDNAPPVISYLGNIALINRNIIAMVGARNASAGACRFARQLALELGERDIVVASGLARGIDTAAHQGALPGGTIAVIAGGIDVAYPPENRALQDEIAARGLLIAEQPPGTEPFARHFPYRNRIIAGIAQATLVVEAAPRSGSLITARLAAEAGRDVMAVPGSPLDPRSRGCNQLIRDGATLIQDVDDVTELLRPIDQRMTMRSPPLFRENDDQKAPKFDSSDAAREAVLRLLSMNYVPVDELIRQSGVGASAVQMTLLELELAGRLERGAGAKVRLTG